MTHYEVLGVPEGASAEHIKDSYRLKMRQYHPDMFQGKPEWVALAEIEAKKINAAYEVLEDAGKRREYDFNWSMSASLRLLLHLRAPLLPLQQSRMLSTAGIMTARP